MANSYENSRSYLQNMNRYYEQMHREMTSLYYGHDAREMILQPLNLLSRASQELFAHPMSPFQWSPLGKIASANFQIAERLTHRYAKPEWGIDQVTSSDDFVYRITPTTLLQKDFCNLVHFKRENMIADAGKGKRKPKDFPKLLIVAPYSGHYATLLRDTVRAMLVDHDVYITDWDNARDVPVYKGTFTLEEYIEYLMEFVQFINDDLHMIAVCQPAVPVLAMTALLAQAKSPHQPKSITLMGGPIDTRRAPTAINKLSKERPLEWFEKHIVGRVPYYYAGSFRRVIPGFIILAGFMNLNLERHAKAPRTLFNHLVKGDADSADSHMSFYDEYRSVLDLPADYYLDSVRTAFQEHLLPRGLMTWKGQRVDTKAIEKTALMTVEGERDDISGVGQTAAAHDICPNIPKNKKVHHLQAEVGHYGVFNGGRWRKFIAPRITAFIEKNR